ncbi:MAG: hypothetical protein ACOCW3_02220, partial [Spirochaetota bacterium]
MNPPTPDPIAAYLEHRSLVSERASRLSDRYDGHLRCRRGCYYCCDEITVLPIEFEALRLWVAENGMPTADRLGGPPSDRGRAPAAIRERDETAQTRRASAAWQPTSVDRSAHGTFPSPPAPRRRCAFLGRSGECTVYEGRPIICRTHGLPLGYRVYEYDL